MLLKRICKNQYKMEYNLTLSQCFMASNMTDMSITVLLKKCCNQDDMYIKEVN